MTNFTVFGGTGFIGKNIVEKLVSDGHSVFIPERKDPDIYSNNLGTVIYCAGNGNCDGEPFKVFEANTALLASILERSKFEKLVYVSSTRLYLNQGCSDEFNNIVTYSSDERRLFNLTKLLGEELCLKSGRNVVIIRPSNVYGLALNSPLFLPAITRDAIQNGVVNMYVSKEYSKDYVSVSDVVKAVTELSLKDNLASKVYNVASGTNTCSYQIADLLSLKTGCKVNWHVNKSSDEDSFPVIDIKKLKGEINFSPRDVIEDLKCLIDDFKASLRG